MKTILILLALLATAFLWLACKNTKYAPGNFPDRQLRWGSGGGVVGKERMYILLDNGQIFVIEGGKILSEVGSTKGKTAKALYETVATLGLEKINFQHPGNIYDFVEVLSGDSVHRISWGAKDQPVDPKIKDLFDQLNGLLKK
jgi:hypothetical protein